MYKVFVVAACKPDGYTMEQSLQLLSVRCTTQLWNALLDVCVKTVNVMLLDQQLAGLPRERVLHGVAKLGQLHATGLAGTLLGPSWGIAHMLLPSWGHLKALACACHDDTLAHALRTHRGAILGHLGALVKRWRYNLGVSGSHRCHCFLRDFL